MFGLGTPELIVILAIAFLIFGGKKLPEIGAGLGKAIGSFRKEIKEVEETTAGIKENIPGVKEIGRARDTLNQAGKVTRFLSK